MRPLALLLALASVSCAQSTGTEILLILRPSCPSSLRNFSLSCLSSMVVSLVDEEGFEYASNCTDFTGELETLADLYSLPADLPVLEDVDERTGVRLQVRAYSAFNKTPCDGTQTESDLLFWGSSDIVDLTDPNLTEIIVRSECRPSCDCDDIAALRCLESFEGGVCAPPPNFLCRRACLTDGDCYGQRASCESDLCAYIDREMCAPCTSANDCNSGRCVANSVTGESFCAVACPPTGDSTPCPDNRIACRNVDGTTFSYNP